MSYSLHKRNLALQNHCVEDKVRLNFSSPQMLVDASYMKKYCRGYWLILLMEEILHQLIGSFSHHLQGFLHPRWCRISSINSNYVIHGAFFERWMGSPFSGFSLEANSCSWSSTSPRGSKLETFQSMGQVTLQGTSPIHIPPNGKEGKSIIFKHAKREIRILFPWKVFKRNLYLRLSQNYKLIFRCSMSRSGNPWSTKH